MRGERGFDLARLYPNAANFDLTISSAEELDVAVGTVAPKIAGPIQARAFGSRKRIGDELLALERGSEIAAREIVAADINLAARADRHRLETIVEQINPTVGDGPADRNREGALATVHFIIRDVPGDFRGAVEVDQPARRQHGAKAHGERRGRASPLLKQ